MKKYNINDPELTQYALGEMSDDESRDFEKNIEGDEEILREIEEIKSFSAKLADTLAKSPEPALSDTRRENILKSAGKSTDSVSENEYREVRRFSWKMVKSVAAVLIAGFVILLIMRRENSESASPISLNVKASNSTQKLPSHHLNSRKLCKKKVSTWCISGAHPLIAKCRVPEYRQPSVRATLPIGTNTENYSLIEENAFRRVIKNPLSTFSIDVDTASYSNIRRFLNSGSLPPPDAVRIEEMINYFSYEYPQPSDGKPFAVNFQIAACPWNKEHKLVKIGLKGREMNLEKRPALNLVFLLDVSGSMSDHNKLPLLKKAMKMLVKRLGGNDRVAIVVYAGASGVVLPSTAATDKEKILASLNRLKSGGSTNGSAGIQLAYKIAVANFIKGGVNRVILATDGDFNVGITSEGDLERLIAKSAKSGVFLTVLGFGMGNYKDSILEKLADKGNGNYAYIDTENEAKKVFVNDLSSTLVTIAKDVKIQDEFNPTLVEGYRLVGYENRMLKKEDFNDDKKDAGEIGAGHTVTVLYEIVPKGKSLPGATVDPLKYQSSPAAVKTPTEKTAKFADELMTVKLRYKAPDGDKSKLLIFPLKNQNRKFESVGNGFKLAAAVAEFGMILRNSQFKGTATFSTALELAREGARSDRFNYRKELINLIQKAKRLKSMK